MGAGPRGLFQPGRLVLLIRRWNTRTRKFPSTAGKSGRCKPDDSRRTHHVPASRSRCPGLDCWPLGRLGGDFA